ncbi:MAG: FecR domain-containing protein [Anaerolineae bacterium]|nr:FecR domain-containing protein [Anaerolineae bacterium]
MRRDIIIISLIVVLALLSACSSDDVVPEMAGDTIAGAAGAPAATEVIAEESAQPVEQAAAPAAAAVDSARTAKAIVVNVSGTVESRAYPNGEFAPLVAGAELAVGDQVRTGPDGQVILELDDGTRMTVAESSALLVASLDGTKLKPISRFYLDIGRVYSVTPGPLPEDASFVIETSSGVASCLGSALAVAFDRESGRTLATCLTGHCAISGGGVTVDLVVGEQAEIDAPGYAPGEKRVMDAEEVEAWAGIIEDMEAAGVAPDFSSDDVPAGVYAPEAYTP